jgi:mannosyltransferase
MDTSSAHGKPAEWTRYDTLWLCALLLVGALVRTPRMTSSLWQDEGYTLSAIFHLNGFDAQRPLYFVILRAWSAFGQGEVWMRVPSLICGVGCVAMMFLIARRLGDRLQAILAAGFMALSTPFVFHSQEARMYTLAPLLLLFAVFAWLRWRSQDGFKWLLLHALAATLALLTFPLVAFGLGGIWAIDAWQQRKTWKRSLPILWVALGAVTIWLPFAVMGATHRWGIAWIPRPPSRAIVDLNAWAFASLDPFELVLEHRLRTCIIGIVLCLALLAAAERKWRGLAIVYFGCTTGLFVVSLLVKPMWVPRYLTPLVPGLFLLTAAGVARVTIRSRILGFGLAGVLFASQLACLLHARRNPVIEDWRRMGDEVSRGARPDDTVVVSQLPLEPNGIGVWSYYYSGQAPVAYFNADKHAAWVEYLSTHRNAVRSTTWVVLTDTSLMESERRSLIATLERTSRVERVSVAGVERLQIRD